MTRDYQWHWNKAREQWVDKFFNEYNPDYEYWQQYRQMYHVDELPSFCDELQYALEGFDNEMEQVKLIYDMKHGHCLKIKWESGAWWAKDPLHFYYCVLLPLDGQEMFDPAELQRVDPKQKKLFWWN